jgi:uncharacterized protein
MKSSSIRSLFVAAILFAAVLVLSAAQPLKVLMITGGCCHDYENQKKILSEGIAARANVTFDIVHEGPGPSDKAARDHMISVYHNKDWAKGYDLILHNECFGYVTNVAFVEGITAAHKAGVPAVMLHCSSHSYRNAQTEEWRQCVGITSVRHDKRREFDVKTVKADHPVMKGFPEVWKNPVADELYENVKIWPNTVPLAQAYSEQSKKDQVVIWVTTYGKGRTFATTLGHDNKTMEDPGYLDLVTRGLLWACNKLNDDGTPKQGYGPVKK